MIVADQRARGRYKDLDEEIVGRSYRYVSLGKRKRIYPDLPPKERDKTAMRKARGKIDLR